MSEPKTELQRNAFTVARRKELETFQRALDLKWLDSRMEDGRMGRCLALIKREAEMEKDYQERTDHAAIVNAKAAKETALGKEIAKIRHDDDCQLLRRYYLRERDPSLRELMKKLQAGYVCRDQKQQILHNQYRKCQDKVEEQRANNILSKALYTNIEQIEKEENDAFVSKTAYCKELQEQLVNRQRQKQCEYEESLIEKKMLEDIMRTIADEDKRELQQKHDLTEMSRYEMQCSMQAREEWKKKQKLKVVMEERAIEEQIKAAGNRSLAILEERERKNRIREETNEKIAGKILEDEAKRKEREDIIRLLQEQEYLEKNCQDDIQEKGKAERTKKETKDALTEQMETKKKMAQQQRESEANFRDATDAKIKAEDEKERLKQEKVQQKRHQYAQELKRQMQDNEIKRRKEKNMEDQRAKDVWDFDRVWRNDVNDERKRIIEEHAPNLLGCLQAGVIRRDDLPTIKSGLSKHEHLAHIDVEPMAAVSKVDRHPKCNPQCKIIREY